MAMRYTLIGTLIVISIVWLLNAFCFCFGSFRFGSSDAIINKAVAYSLSDGMAPGSEEAVARFRLEHPDCCGVTDWYGGDNAAVNFVLGSLFFARRVEVAVATPLTGDESGNVYLRYWKVDPCGRAYPGFGTELSREEAAGLIKP